MTKKITQGISAKKQENFSEWYSQVLEKAELIDLRYDVKGFVVVRPWGAMIIENMYNLYEEALQKKGHKPCFFPTLIPEKNFKKESQHVEGFSPDVFWLEKSQGDEKLALRPTSETAMYQMYSLWIRGHRDLPLKLYQRANVFRYETKATRPLIRAREFYWIEAHDCFATKKEAEEQVKEDICTTEEVMHQKFGIPFFPMKRPVWDTFPGAVYTIGSDVIMPDGKLLQQPSTHFLGQSFSKAFNVKFLDENEKEQNVWQTCYGPAISRMLASVISTHGDDKGLVLPFCISPIQVVIIPIFNKDNKERIIQKSIEIKNELESFGITSEIDDSEKRPGEKYYNWELKGVPMRIELGEKELNSEKLVVYLRDLNKKVDLKKLSDIKTLGIDFDKRIREKAEDFEKKQTVDCLDIGALKKAMKDKKLARVNFCSMGKEGLKCAEFVEKELGAEVRGVIANKNEKVFGDCVVCGEKAEVVSYIGKSY